MCKTINFHLNNQCNYHCKFCFAHKCGATRQLDFKSQIELVKILCAREEVKKINFVGGEPTLLGENLKKLLKTVKSCGDVKTSVTINGSRIDAQWVADYAPYLDILTLSVDSDQKYTNQLAGRCDESGKALSPEHILSLADACRRNNILLKINTVVSRFNVSETLADLINKIRPFRWKILQVLEVADENSRSFGEYAVTKEEFENYVSRQNAKTHPSVEIVKEDNELMRGSYLMVNPAGCFFDNTYGKYTISQPILDLGFQKALEQIHFNERKFKARGGIYSIPDKGKTIGPFFKSTHFIHRQAERTISDTQLSKILERINGFYNGKGVFIVNSMLMKEVGLNRRGQSLIIAFDRNVLVTLFLIANVTNYMYEHPFSCKILL